MSLEPRKESSAEEDRSFQREPHDVKPEVQAPDLGIRTSVAVVETLDSMIGTGTKLE